ncbi:MAG: YggS family pyridoxal phosphate-dependent enzyme [Proteobacteria bacterium SW_6_67_9]|nr:MAG: YggS family pyridoxal phosphate-dependent enzyme [Proteobacteria bacterium SW_6_67_9]
MSEVDSQRIRDGLAAVERRIEAACRGAGRDPASVQLLPVTKTLPPAALRVAVDAGYRALGENRVQEASDKADALTSTGIEWHMIGHLQRNKVKQALAFAHCIQSVDRQALAQRLADQLANTGECCRVLIQVNTSGAPSQYGVAPERAGELARYVAARGELELTGLMTIGRLVDAPEDARDCFRTLRELRDRLADELGQALPELSMGMSGDMEVAIDEGATLVRAGSAIFGARS